MQYYKNSMRYTKLFLIFVIFLAIFTTFIKNHAISLSKMQSQNTQDIMDQIQKEKETVQGGMQQSESPEDVYVRNRFNEYLSLNPNTRTDSYEIIKEQFRKEFRERQNANVVEFQNNPQEVNMHQNMQHPEHFGPPPQEPMPQGDNYGPNPYGQMPNRDNFGPPSQGTMPNRNYAQNHQINNNQSGRNYQEVPEENVPMEQILEPYTN